MLLEGLNKGSSSIGVAMSTIYDMTSICVTIANEEGVSAVEKRYNIPPTPGGIELFDTVGWVHARHDQGSQTSRIILAFDVPF